MIEALGDLLEYPFSLLWGFLNGIIDAIGDALSAVLEWVGNVLNNLWLDYIKPLLIAIKDWALHLLNDGINNAIETTGAADWLFDNQSTVVSAIHWIDSANGIFPLVELVGGIAIVLATAVVAFALKIAVKAVRG